MNKIKHILKKIFHRTDFSGLSVLGRGQRFDWEMLLSFLLLIFVIVVSFSVHVFLGVRAGDIFTDDYKPPVHNITINKTVLDNVLRKFDLKAMTAQKLETSKPVFVDPSL